ncbi:CheA Signal Transduction Histidine Kinases (STHK) [Rhodospirillum rubrum ATCC 11170]|uniref:Chemotaxis protein CheA n=1 Tax=Rhodospirillum rubrum (strain ATCC 11170 / ATH 1.1.1 / DSM 467 / LMG 4362 / NCIMB 8255 / S1) TaxID=269796 RepID=Q2RUJ5_RHORT|nr:chemotaxis protein CheA [Rhodospirillum rubrum]ABC22200.1 CheA Signal Transduction Histidine Kinases (STHK) [Rhodospirillum rubrum ATCC 11170]MBK5953789.1 chemotaxis protein CheA [Rhodospirillum rubrum]QXG81846.1 chemotaxis protein CheA [Rhodospirillum rubrum]HCF19585.1 chemotaxis protein CheA [Rhodospirillum rubrum]
MTPMDPSETFRQEAQELLEQLEQALLDLEHAPDDGDLIDSAFRALHTIKGSGSMFGFDAVAAFTHHVETAFDLVRKGKVTPSRELIAVALAAKDRMRLLIEQPETPESAEGDAILRDLKAIVDASDLPSAGEGGDAPVAAREQPAEITWRIRFRLARDAMAMGTNPLLLLDELRTLGSATIVALTGEVPSLEVLVPSDCHLAWDVMLTTSQPRTAIEDVFMFVIDDMELSIDLLESGEEDRRIGEILVERGDVAQEAVDTAVSRQLPLGTLLVESGNLSPDKLTSALAEQQHLRTETKVVAKGADSIRVPAERLDELMDRVGELVIAQSRLTQVAASINDMQVKAIAEEIERLAHELRDTTMGVRMVPISSLFGRFRRLVHDLAHDLGKQIELTTFGEETELDKTVIERLNDPLIHLIRNSIDHGLETPEGRKEAGKPPAGRITLSARHSGAEVLVSIIDDGRGLDRARIQARAEEQGLLAPGVKLSDNDLFQVIFQAGFSTAKVVTSLSGRGVGMDVVKRTIEGLRGKIDIASTPGKGTELTLRLPLTLAIIDGLLVRVGKARYVLPLSAVEECVELSAEEDGRSRGRSFLNIRGDLVPFLRLRELFQVSAPADPYQKVVIVSSGEFRVGLVVDQVIGNHQTVIKSLSKLHADVETFSGATILGDGAVALILDIGHLVKLGLTYESQFMAAG